MKTTKYFASSILIATLSACNSGGTAPSASSSNSSTSSNIVPIGALLAPAAAETAETYTTLVYPEGKKIQSVKAVDDTGSLSAVVTANLGDINSQNSSCATCAEPMVLNVYPANANDNNALSNTLLVVTYTDGTISNFPLPIRKVTPGEEEVVTATPSTVFVNSDGSAMLT